MEYSQAYVQRGVVAPMLLSGSGRGLAATSFGKRPTRTRHLLLREWMDRVLFTCRDGTGERPVACPLLRPPSGEVAAAQAHLQQPQEALRAAPRRSRAAQRPTRLAQRAQGAAWRATPR